MKLIVSFAVAWALGCGGITAAVPPDGGAGAGGGLAGAAAGSSGPGEAGAQAGATGGDGGAGASGAAGIGGAGAGGSAEIDAGAAGASGGSGAVGTGGAAAGAGGDSGASGAGMAGQTGAAGAWCENLWPAGTPPECASLNPSDSRHWQSISINHTCAPGFPGWPVGKPAATKLVSPFGSLECVRCGADGAAAGPYNLDGCVTGSMYVNYPSKEGGTISCANPTFYCVTACTECP